MWSAALGGAAGFAGGFFTAQSLYSSESEREKVHRSISIGVATTVGVSVVFGLCMLVRKL